MLFRFGSLGGAVVICLATVAAPASAQFVIGNGGMSINGVDLSAYGGVASVEVMDSGYVTPGFQAGVIGPYAPYGPGWGGGGFYSGAYPTAYYGRSYGGFGYGGFGYGGGYWGGNFVAAPLVIPAETMYGPGPVRRMMGLDPPLGTPIINQTVINTPPQPRPNGFGVLANPQPQGVPGRPNVIASNPQTQQRARKLVDAGDVAFQQQRFAEALSQYKDAARAAPDLADAYFRQAAASIALGRYEDAAASIKFGLRLSTNWIDSRFRFAALYGPAALARQQHMAALAQAAVDRPTSDVLFVYGVSLFFDDHPRWAQGPLERAQALALGEAWHIDLFLKAIDRLPHDAAAPPAVPQQPAPQPVVPAQRPADDGARDI